MLAEFPVYQSAQSVIDLWVGIPEAVARELSRRRPKDRSVSNESFVGEAYDEPARSIGLAMVHRTDRDVTALPGSEPIAPGGAAKQVWDFVRAYGLLTVDHSGRLALTEEGRRFQEADQALVSEIDRREGIADLLDELLTLGASTRAELMPRWALRLSPPLEKPEHFYTHRRRNLLARHLVESPRRGVLDLTDAGRQYARLLGQSSG